MRILVFYQYFTTRSGSWSTRYFEFARRWVDAGAEVTVVTSAYDKSDIQSARWSRREVFDGINVIVLGSPVASSHGFGRRIAGFLHYALAASWYALTLPADVVIASSGPITVGIPGLVAKVLRRRKLVFEVRDLWPQGALELGVLRRGPLASLAQWFARLCYRKSSRVVALSSGMRDGILSEVSTAAVTVIPNASDCDLFRPRPGMPRGDVVYAGSLGRMDDALQLIGVAEEMRRRGRADVTIRVFGEGVDREELVRQVAMLGLESFLRVEGLISKNSLAAILPGASCALVLFRAGPVMDTVSPNKLFDALAAGVPVVQTTQGWIKEMLAESGAGLTVRARDSHAMASAILELVDDAERRNIMGSAGRRLAELRFSRDALAREYVGVLEEVSASTR